MPTLIPKTEIPVEFDTIVDRRTVVHELALDGDEELQVVDHVALVNDGVSIVAVVTAIDDSGYIHLALRGRRRDPDLSRATHGPSLGRGSVARRP